MGKQTYNWMQSCISKNNKRKSIEELKVTIKRPSIRIMRVPEDAEREAGIKGIFKEIKRENIANLETELGNNTKEGHRTHNRVDQKGFSPQNLINKLTSIGHKEKNPYMCE